MKKMKLTKNKLILIVFTVIVFLSVGYSAFNSSAMIKNIAATVRLNGDIRVTNITINNSTTDVVSNYTDYDVKSISSEVYLPYDDSSITYKVSITNFESIEMGIFDITGLPDNLEYSISEYLLKEKICNENNKCNLGITKDIYITINYKNGKNESDKNLYNFKLEFDFRSYHKVNYKNIYGMDYPTEVIDGDKLVLDLEYDDVNLSITNSVGYIYVLDTDYKYENGILTIPTVNQDLYVEVKNKILITNVISNSDTSETIKYFDNRLNTSVTLSNSISSQQTFNITIYNYTNNSYTFTGVTYDENNYDNENITFALSGLEIGDIIASGESKQFSLIFKYANEININSENVLNSFLEFNFEIMPYLSYLIKSHNNIIEETPTLTDSSNNTSDTSGLYLSTATTNGEATYYFRGDVKNNYVEFANKTWKIIRINEDNTIRIMLTERIDDGNMAFNDDNKSYLSMYYTHNSNAKNQLDNWYSTNISNTEFDQYVANGMFCEQAKAKIFENWTGGEVEMAYFKNYEPNFDCDQDENGKGLVKNEDNILVKVGLITYDEIIHAGGYYNKNNTSYYIYNGSYGIWTMSPGGFSSTTAYLWAMRTQGLLSDRHTHYGYGIMPVINLNANVLASGTGIENDPYKVITK